MIYIPFWLMDLAIWIPVVALLVATGISTYTDIKWRKILNKVTFTTFFAGLAWNVAWILIFILYMGMDPATVILGTLIDIAIMFAIAFGIFYVMYMMGGMGAGDVKLVGALSLWIYPWKAEVSAIVGELTEAWISWQLVIWLVALIAVAGGIFAIYYIRKAKLGKEALQYVKMGGQVKLDLVDQQKTYIPYGVPIAVGTLAFILFIWL